MTQDKEIKRILIIDDEHSNCNMLLKYLRSLGYSCQSATDPHEALRLLGQNLFEVIISDIVMPEMDGLELMRSLPKVDSAPDVIIMTGFTQDYTYSDIIKGGAADFLIKPFALPELKAKVERIGRERKMQKELRDLNTTLGVLLQRTEKDKEALAENIASNLQATILPYIERLKSIHLSIEAKQYVEVLESNLSEICSPLTKNLSLQIAGISPTEVQVANLVKCGKRNKEIAEILGVSLNTVLTHRYRLRTKLGLKREKVNLRSYLNSIDI